MTESKDPSESNESDAPNPRPEPDDPFAPGQPPPGWSQPAPGKPWEYQQPPPPAWRPPSEPIGPPQEQIPPEQIPPHWQQPYGAPPGPQPPYGQQPPPGRQWGPPPGQPWGPPGGPQWNQYGAYAGEKPNNYLVWAILSTILCCIPFGVVSIVFANKVNSRWMAGDVAGAREASNNARTWAIVSAVTGLVLSVLLVATGALGS